MSFSNFKSLGATVKELQVIYTEANFVTQAVFPVSEYFQQDLEYVMREGVVNNSEFAICENLIYPILKEVWKAYSSKSTLWSHQMLTAMMFYQAILSMFWLGDRCLVKLCLISPIC
jgi:hypothetical protein